MGCVRTVCAQCKVCEDLVGLCSMGPYPIPPEQVLLHELLLSLLSMMNPILVGGKEALDLWFVVIAPFSTTQQVCLVC